jgi:hypothetical protein
MVRLSVRSASSTLIRGLVGARFTGRRSGLAVLLAGSLAAMLAGCGAGVREDPRIATERSAVTADQSFVSLPAGGPAILGVIEKRYSNAIMQKTILSNSSHFQGENYLTVVLFGDVKLTTNGANSWPDDFITPSLIASETRWALPGLALKPSPYFAQNKYGPFGYATARTASGDICLYAWQRIARHQGRMFIGETGSISVRLRLCGGRSTSEAALLSVMYGFAIDAYFLSWRWNPYGAPPPVSKTLGELNAPIVPPVDSGPRVPIAARRTTPAASEDDAPEVIMAPTAPIVPESRPTTAYPIVPRAAD